MEFTLKRLYSKPEYTIGKLYVDGKYLCDTIEDRERILRSASDKVYGETAIPRGKYRISLTWSHKFNRELPLIEDVPFFSGIRIHRGNTEKDSSGCVIVGENKRPRMVINSTYWEEKIVALFRESKDKYHYISVVGA